MKNNSKRTSISKRKIKDNPKNTQKIFENQPTITEKSFRNHPEITLECPQNGAKMGPKIIKKGGPQRDPRPSDEKYEKKKRRHLHSAALNLQKLWKTEGISIHSACSAFIREVDSGAPNLSKKHPEINSKTH